MENNCVIIKDVVGYEGLYKVTSDGNIISLGNGNSTNSETKKVKQMIIGITDKGYTKIKLSKNSVTKYHSIHRLVAKAFIPNPDNKPQVNHINGIKTDNRVENLEWVTHKENSIHAFNMGFYKHKLRKIIGINIKTGIINEFESIEDAAKKINGNRGNIHKCLNKINNRLTAYGYKWEYSPKLANQKQLC